MGRIIQTIILTLALFLPALAEIEVPWAYLFEDTLFLELQRDASKSLLSSSYAYGNYNRHTDYANWIFYPSPTFWVRPQLNFRNENFGDPLGRVSQLDGQITAGREVKPWLDFEAFVAPHRFWSQLGDVLPKKLEDSYSAGLGFRVFPLQNLALYGSGNKNYLHHYDENLDGYRNPGWGGEVLGQSILPLFVLDTARVSLAYAQNDRERGEDQFSHIRVLGTPALSNMGDSLYWIYKQTRALTRDDFRNISESNSNKDLSLCYAKKFQENIEVNLFGSYNWKNKEYVLTPIQNSANTGFDLASRAKLEKNTWGSQGVLGYGKYKEDVLPGSEFTFTSADSATTRRNLLDNDQSSFYLQGELFLFPVKKIKIEWHGYGKIESRDYGYSFRLPSGDTLSSDLDNDNTTVNHWVQVGYVPADPCSLFWEGRYSEYRIQYLKSRYSGGNRLQQIYSFIPSAFCQVGNFMDWRQALEINANYTKNPFAPASNSLYRQLRTNSQVHFYVWERNTFLLFYEYINSDQGAIDLSNYYSIQEKRTQHHWAVEYKRNIWQDFFWQPGFGRIYNNQNSFDFSSRQYAADPLLTGSSWIYSFKAYWIKSRSSFLKMNVSYFNESTGNHYWDSNLSIQMGF